VSRDRRVVFGETADEYDRFRPGYPDALVDDVLALAGPGPALEVGAGTGKATVPFAARGLDLTAVEPDPRMAVVLRRRVTEPIEIVVASFEDWAPDRRYGLLFSAQAWHWIDPDRRAALARAALAPGGLLALFWNSSYVADAGLHAALAEVDARHGLADDHTAHTWGPDRWPITGEPPGPDDPAFTDLPSRRYLSDLSYDSADYRRYLLTTSVYRIMPEERAAAALDDTTAVIDAHGGTIRFRISTELALARAV
jgi:SAM-dependent methyltransferase